MAAAVALIVMGPPTPPLPLSGSDVASAASVFTAPRATAAAETAIAPPLEPASGLAPPADVSEPVLIPPTAESAMGAPSEPLFDVEASPDASTGPAITSEPRAATAMGPGGPAGLSTPRPGRESMPPETRISPPVSVTLPPRPP